MADFTYSFTDEAGLADRTASGSATVNFRTSASSDTGTVSAASLNLTIPGSAQIDDIAIVTIASERDVTPTLPSGFTQIQAETNSTNMSSVIGWKRLVSGDPGATITTTVSSNRRMTMGILVLSGSADLSSGNWVVGTYSVASSGVYDASCPNITPAGNDAVLVGIVNSRSSVAPYIRTWTPSSGWTERYDDGSAATASINAFTYVATKALTGGSGVLQTGLTVTCDSPQYAYWPTSIAVLPSGATYEDLVVFTSGSGITATDGSGLTDTGQSIDDSNVTIEACSISDSHGMSMIAGSFGDTITWQYAVAQQ